MTENELEELKEYKELEEASPEPLKELVKKAHLKCVYKVVHKDDINTSFAHCPRCDKTVTIVDKGRFLIKPDYCGCCGQHLDWRLFEND